MKNFIIISNIFIVSIIIFCVLTIFFEEKKVKNMIIMDNHLFEMLELKIDLENEKRLVELLKTEIVEMSLFSDRVKKVKITFYSPPLGGINTDGNPEKTAIMEKPIVGWTCAISRDLVKLGWLGQKIYIQGIGIRYANDIMGKSINGKKIERQIDILVGKRDVQKEAKKLGNNIDITASLI